jgi:phosphopantothenate-cysteine ligase
MHRQFSLQPFSRHYSHSTNPFLDFLEIHNGTNDLPQITVAPEKRRDLLEVLAAYKSVQAAGVLHTLTFVTVNDYLWLLRSVSHELSVLGKNAMYYLAAAVSDFFLPRQKMVSKARQKKKKTAIFVYSTRRTVGTQDSIWKREPQHRDGPGAQDS